VTVTVFLGSLLAAMALGMPIAFALIVCGMAMMLYMDNFDSQIIALNMMIGADNFVLMAVPFFLLTGEFMIVGGLSRRIVNMAMALVGHMRGGLGYATIIAAIIMASLSGSAVADTAAVSALLIPMMRDAGYNVSRSAGLIAASGVIAPVIPPSIGFIIFGVAGGVSITKLFVAGVFPGILMGLSLAFTWWLVSRREVFALLPRQSTREVLNAIARGFWALVLPVIIIGGLKSGVFTPTEAAVVAATYSLFVGLFVYREMKFRDIYRCLVGAAKTTGVIMFLVSAAFVSAWLIAIADLPGQVTELLAPFIDDKIMLMFMMMLLVVAVGTAMDFVPTILILTPVLMPLCKQAGIDPVYFGVVFIMNNAIGLITPPVGTVLNVVCGVARISMDDVIKGVWPFLLAELLVLFLLVFFPGLVTVPARLFG
jgi:tripartite ATP-independent transporter DctM subunit